MERTEVEFKFSEIARTTAMLFQNGFYTYALLAGIVESSSPSPIAALLVLEWQ